MNMRDSFIDVERHRLRLDENLVKLQRSLQHWQTWEAEYEGLKEDILGLGANASSTDIVAIGRDFGGTLVDEQEIKTLLGDGKSVQRTATQVADLVSRRIDYVVRNIRVVEHQIITAEEKLNALMIIRQPEVGNKEGLPLTEIREELDEDGNVIASTTTRPGDAAPQVVEALRKAGVTDFPSVQNVEAESPRLPENLQSSHIAPPQPLDEEDSMKFIAEATRTDKLEDLQRSEAQDFKSTTGNNDSGNAAKPLTERTTVDSTVSLPGLNRSATRNVVSSAQINPPLQSTTVADQIENDTTPLVIPTDESPEDAALRRQMIQYGLHEVGAVVAELDLDEDSESQFSFSADDSDDDQQHSSSAEEEEDKFGRTTRRVVDDDYRREMLDLENKLKARATKAIEPIVPRSSPEVNGMSEKESTKLPGTSVLRDKVERSTVKKKGVRFAEELDISPAPAQGSTSKPTRITAGEAAPAIRDAIVERAAPRETPSTEASPMPQRVSRFKTARAAANYNGKFPAMRTGDPHIVNGPLKGPILERGLPNATPSLPLIAATSGKRKDFTGPIQATGEGHARQMPEGPQGKTHVHSIIEHEVSSHEPDAPDPDDMDPALLQQEVAIEYHRMRNRMIQRQGGFLPRDNEDEERVPLTEEEGGTGKKMSRFKAARLRKHA